MIGKFKPVLLLAPVVLLSACVSMPAGPSVMVLPGSGRTFEQFQIDDTQCRQYAHFQLQGASPEQAALDSGVRSAALGTALGAVAGAAINGSHGAGVGAGTGFALGGLSGANAGNVSGYQLQRLYDNAYQQCMYAKGHRVPLAGGFAESRTTVRSSNAYYPPPSNLPPASAPSAPPPPARY